MPIINMQKFKGFFKENKRRFLNLRGILSGRFAYKGPDVVQIDLTDKCNSRCSACWIHSPLGDHQKEDDFRELDFEKLKIFIKDISKSGTKEINFSGGGEPFCYPKIWEAIEFAQNEGLTIRVNTNFTLLDAASINRLSSFQRLASVAVSVWSGDGNTYAKVHNRDKEIFQKLKDNLVLLNKAKHPGLKVKIYAVITNMNYTGLKGMADFAIETGSDFIEFGVTDVLPGITDKLLLSSEQLSVLQKEFIGVCDYLENKGKKPKLINKDIFLKRISNSKAYRGEYDPLTDKTRCFSGWTFLRLRANGDFNSCLKSHRIPIGNIYQDGFSSIWNNSLQQEFRKKALSMPKDKDYFKSIGDSRNSEIGCFRICDNVLVNERLHGIIKYLF